jgi:O-antigen/teichoic acid export membrane protein
VSNKPQENSKTLRGKIISGSLVLLSGSSVASAINLAYNVAIAHFLGPKGFGTATTVYTLLTLTSAVTLAFQIVSTKVVAQQTTETLRDEAYRDLLRTAWACGLVVAVLFVAFERAIVSYLRLPDGLLVVMLAVGTAFYVPLGVRRGYIQGAFGFRRLATNLVLEGAARLVGSVLMILLGFDVPGVIFANAVAIAVAYFAIRPKLTPPEKTGRRFGSAIREIVHAGIFYSGQVLINNCDIVLVKHFFAAEEAGVYAAVAMVGRVTFAFSSAVVNSMFPVVASTHHQQRKNLSLIATSLLMVLAVGGIFALGLLLAPAWLWTLCFGSRFVLAGQFGFPYLLALYAITTVTYSLSVVVITYEMSYKLASNSWVQLVMSCVVIAAICRFHGSLQQVIMVQLVLMLVLFVAVTIPFLFSTLRSPEAEKTATTSSIRLVRPISEDEVLAEFIKSDFRDKAYNRYRDRLQDIILSPNLADDEECARRRALLFLRHRSLWQELPRDTQWYEAELGPEHLELIRVFPRAHWRKLARGNFNITQVAERIQRESAAADAFAIKIANIRRRLVEDDATPGAVILIGIDGTQPMTVIDGNHRFVSAVIEGRVDRLRVLCGLSPQMSECCWYRTSVANLARYGRNLLRSSVRQPESELKSVLARSQ